MASDRSTDGITLPQDPVPARELEAHVVRILQSGGIKGDSLKELAGAVAKLNQAGLRPVKVFPKGIPVPDGVGVHTFVTPETVGRFFELLREIPQIDEIRLFPKGIPFPDILQVEVGIR
jgi:hypothetical protein